MHATWTLREPDSAHYDSLRAAGHDTLIARLLALRGLHDPASAQAFLTPQLRDLPDPYQLADCQAAAELLVRAVRSDWSICVYGDYDVDGISAAALLHDVLTMAGGRPRVFLPDRMRDGYGLRLERLHELADQGVKLFISADCGSTAVAEVAAMRARGIDFVICDHHALGPSLPPATCHLNPRRPDCGYPDKNLCAVGVAFVLAQAFRRAAVHADLCPAEAFDLRSVIELAALGTIADVVELKHVNRTLAWHGLRALGVSARPGLRALVRHLPVGGVDAQRVGFVVGPKINAAGRVAEPRTAFDVLTVRDADTAEMLAVQLDVENNRRKALTDTMVAEAMELARATPVAGAVVVGQHGWHPGVVGIVAARLVETFHMPAFAIAVDDSGTARGSGRSVPGYDLVGALRESGSDLLDRFGGHAFAAGITLPSDAIDALRQRLSEHAAQRLGATPATRNFEVDAELSPADCDLALLDRLERLEPFGRGNEAPRFLLRNVEVRDLQEIGKTGGWGSARLHVRGAGSAHFARPAVKAFGAWRLWQGRSNGEPVDVVCKLQRNSYKGSVSVQAVVDLVAPAAS